LPLVETDEKAEIQENNSPLAAFFAECLVVEHNARVRRSDVYAAYETWRAREGQEELSGVEIGTQIQTLTCGRVTRTTTKAANAYKHLRLRTDAEKAAAIEAAGA